MPRKAVFLLGAWLLVAVVILMAGVMLSHQRGAAARGFTAKTKVAVACAKDYADIGPVLRAYRDRDLAAAVGLVQRGKALDLDRSERVRVLDSDSGAVAIEILSGSHSGETCWIDGTFLE